MGMKPGIGMLMGAAIGLSVDMILGTMPLAIFYGPGLGLIFVAIFRSRTDSRE